MAHNTEVSISKIYFSLTHTDIQEETQTSYDRVLSSVFEYYMWFLSFSYC